jgi:arginine-tRNA-protein transferase
LADGLSLVYSFYDPTMAKRSLGSFIILDHIVQASLAALPYVYLGYWVQGSPKMDYKAKFNPVEVLRPGGWALMARRDRVGTEAG